MDDWRNKVKRLALLAASLGLVPALGATAVAATQERRPTAQASKGPWVGVIYIDLDGAPGADRAIELFPNRTWELLEPSGRPGLYDVKLASGAVVADGKLDRLPATAFHGARVIWKAGTVTTLIKGKRIPSPEQLCDGNAKRGLRGDFIVPTEKHWLEYCSRGLTRR